MPTYEASSTASYPSYRRTSKKKPSLFLSVLLTISALISAIFIVIQNAKLDKLQDEIRTAKQQLTANSSELSVLRAISPHQYNYEKILTNVTTVGDLSPGWVTRIYKTPSELKDIDSMLDIGSFVLDQTKFTLASHQSYGLDTVGNVLYRMNGLLPNQKAGRFQIGIEFSYTAANPQTSAINPSDQSCFVQLNINEKNVIDTTIRFSPSENVERLITGNAQIEQGLHPISTTIYCDEPSKVNNRSIHISLNYRSPGESQFRKSRNAVFYINQQHAHQNTLTTQSTD